MTISLVDAANAIRKLAIVYAPPKGIHREDLEGAWKTALQGVSPEALEKAITEYVKSEARFFPKPGQIRKLAEGMERPPSEGGKPSLMRQVAEGPCPVCSAVLQLAPHPLTAIAVYDPKARRGRGGLRRRTKDDPAPKQSFAIVHDYDLHVEARVPIIGQSNRNEYASLFPEPESREDQVET